MYRYYTCYKHKRYKSCKSQFKSVSAELLEQNVIDEVMRILKSPEVVVQINKLVERESVATIDTEPKIEGTELFDAIKNLRESWDYLYHEEKRKILALVVKSVNVMDDGIKINLNLEGFDEFLVELAA